jgi:hypothetical protein
VPKYKLWSINKNVTLESFQFNKKNSKCIYNDKLCRWFHTFIKHEKLDVFVILQLRIFMTTICNVIHLHHTVSSKELFFKEIDVIRKQGDLNILKKRDNPHYK